MHLFKRVMIAALVPGCIAVVSASAQSCVPFWTGTGTTSHVGTAQTDYALAVYDDGTGEKLYAAGHMFQGVPWNRRIVARWDGRKWEVLDAGMPPGTTLVGDPRVLRHGSNEWLMIWTRQDTMSSPLHWTGTAWVPAPPELANTYQHAHGTSAHHRPMYSLDDGSGMAIHGVRYSTTLGNTSMDVIRWTGSGWQQLGGTFNSSVRTMAMFDSGNGPQLHVAGGFSRIDGVPFNRAARWNGSAWEQLGPGLGSTPRSLIVFDDGQGAQLYATPVTNIAGVPVDGLIARWDGQQWSATPGGVSWAPNYLGAVRRLAVFDDGYGPALYVTGLFSEAGGVPVRNVARWDGSPIGGWSGLGHGIGNVWDMAVFDDGRGPSLFFGGNFVEAGGAPARGVVQWVGCHDQCYADCNNDQQLSIDDWLCFIDKFARGDPYADCNQDLHLTVDDFHCFITRFAENCR